MGALDGRVAIVTGAGRGIGREEALLLAREGALVVVNDVGSGTAGQGADAGPAAAVVAEIRDTGGQAVASHHDVADEEGASGLIDTALDAFGDLHVLVNNAGILRDRMVVNMSVEEWDDIMRVHLRGHFLPTRWAARYWRDEAKAGRPRRAAIVNTSSTSGLFGNVGQANYGTAKSGIATFTTICHMELDRYGVRCNAIAPNARTRLTLNTPGLGERIGPPESGFDRFDPANIAPFVAYLATEDCPLKGGVFYVHGGEVHLFQPWAIVDRITCEGRWTIAALQREAARFAGAEFNLGKPF